MSRPASRNQSSCTDSPHSRAVGAHWETVAERFLCSRSLKPLDRNFHCHGGEVDLVMLDQNTVVFVEVRFRQSDHFGSGAATVTRSKQKRIVKAARRYLHCHPQWRNRACRFDVVSIGRGQQQDIRIQWLRQAFDAGRD